MKRIDLDEVEKELRIFERISRHHAESMIHELRLLRRVDNYHARTAARKQRLICNGCRVQQVPTNYKELDAVTGVRATYSDPFPHLDDCPVKALEETE